MTTPPNRTSIQVDIVSDVVCPWCYIGFRQLQQALTQTGIIANLRWHPFELNTDMPPEGQNLRAHLMGKYGLTVEQSQGARDRLRTIGADLGIDFRHDDNMRMVNTFRAHQLLDWADGLAHQTPLKLELFKRYFTDGQDVSDNDVLVDAAITVGLDGAAARAVLDDGTHVQATRSKQRQWIDRGITGVPAMVFAAKYLVTGAQGSDGYAKVLNHCLAEVA